MFPTYLYILVLQSYYLLYGNTPRRL